VDVAEAAEVAVVAAALVAAALVAAAVVAAAVVVAAALVVDPDELVLEVHPASAVATATTVSIAARPAREPGPVPMAGRYSRASGLSAG
jgi:hypothetical protein